MQDRPALPEGFLMVHVPVSRREFENLRLASLLTASGTPAGALRMAADMSEEPLGIKVARLRAALAESEDRPHDRPHVSTECWCGKSWDLLGEGR